MFKKVLLSVAVILFVSTASFAQYLIMPPVNATPGSIYQTQNFIVGDPDFQCSGISTILTVSHGESAHSFQGLSVHNQQSVPSYSSPDGFNFLGWWGCDECTMKANEQQDADLKVDADAESDCGIITVSAFLSGWGEQGQFIGYADDPKGQAQVLGLASDQVLLSTGNADGFAVNDIDNMGQDQVGKNGAGSMSQNSDLDSIQVATTYGDSNTTISVVNSMMATTAQAQQVY